MANSEPFNQRKIKLPLAVDTGGARKKTQDIYLAFSRIYAFSTPLKGDGEGALVYSKEDKKPLQTVQTFNFKALRAELERKTDKGLPVYRHNFVCVGPRLIVNMDLLREAFLDTKIQRLTFPLDAKNNYVDLDKEQITFLTERLAEKDYESRNLSLTSIMNGITERREYRQSFDMTFGCLVALSLAMLVNMGLLIAILCIVLK